MALQILEELQRNDSNLMHLHTTVEISQYCINSFYRPLRDTSEEYLEKVGEKGAELVRRVIAIPGVKELFIHPYELTLVRSSSLFEWEDIVPAAKKAIKVIFGREREEVKYLSLAEIPIIVILVEPWKRLGWLIRKAWYRIPNLAQ